MEGYIPFWQYSSSRDSLGCQKREQIIRVCKELDRACQVFMGWSTESKNHTREIDALSAALEQGIRLSVYVREQINWLWASGLIAQTFRPVVERAADLCLTQPYSTGWLRRPMRARNPAVYADKVRRILQGFAEDPLLAYDLPTLLTGRAPQAALDYMESMAYRMDESSAMRIAIALNEQDAAVEAAIREMIDGDGKPFMMREVICGILYSDRSDLYELLGRMLVAARLQEGLRQTICENADMGTLEAFKAMVRVIDDNGLIRFSGVKRAVGVWLGLISEESGDLERIGSKSIALIRRTMEDAAFREDCLQGEDSMQLYTALWSMGLEDVQAAADRAWQLACEGTHHQRLTAGCFAGMLNAEVYASALAQKVLLTHSDELDTVAVYLPFFLGGMENANQLSKARDLVHKPEYRAEAEYLERMYALFLGLRDRVKKKLVFEHCVFPWNRAVLERSQVANCLCVLAYVLGDDARIDQTAAFFGECSAEDRELMLSCCYGKMRTPAQRELVFQALCDRAEYCRKAARWLVESVERTDEDIQTLESLLRFKYPDARVALIRMLMAQSEAALKRSVQRLLSDKLEERRMAALDMIKQILEEPKYEALRPDCGKWLSEYQPGPGEKPLIHSLREMMGKDQAEGEPELFDESDRGLPEWKETPALTAAMECFARYFPDSGVPAELGGRQPVKAGEDSARQAAADLNSLCACYDEHRMDPVEVNGEQMLLGNTMGVLQYNGDVLLEEVWKGWYEQSVGDPRRLMRACVMQAIRSRANEWAEESAFGPGFRLFTPQAPVEFHVLHGILTVLVRAYVPRQEQEDLAAVLLCWMARCLPGERLWLEKPDEPWLRLHVGNRTAFIEVLGALNYGAPRFLPELIHAGLLLESRSEAEKRTQDGQEKDWAALAKINENALFPSPSALLFAGYQGAMSRRSVYAWLFSAGRQKNAVKTLTGLRAVYRARGRQFSRRSAVWFQTNYSVREELRDYLGKEKPESDGDWDMLGYADRMCQPVVERILRAELSRGDSETEYSRLAGCVTYLEGADAFTAILAALGKDKLIRNSYLQATASRTECLCWLLMVCVPGQGEDAATLKRLVKQRGIEKKRLIEAALYCPEWVEPVGEALNWPAFRSAAYYFMAHMNEDFDEVKRARIARFTPLSIEELNSGAFDIEWFRSAYEAMGEKNFDLIYEAAKYITSGAKHTRARRYADAVLGKLDAEAIQKEIAEKRNKDLLMAYALIPLKGQGDVQARYLYIQQFLKESRSFGAQRAAAEKTACDMALTNLAHNAGYPETMRLILRMETRMAEEKAELFQWQELEGVRMRLTADEQGLVSLCCEKAGKALKSVPAALKKHPAVLALVEAKKQLTEQQRRARKMLEQAMEDSTAFSAGEIAQLMENPVLSPMLSRLVFMRSDQFGFTDGRVLTGASGESTALDERESLRLAHPFHLWKAGEWTLWQQKLFEGRIVQPIRQVFRELYVKTGDERNRRDTLRYAGYQLQPAKTRAVLSARRWLADPENGLQKVYYKENIVAVVFGISDWFTPADIEAPTLESVAFFDRRSGRALSIDEVPDLIFSEVMRDVDLAVSVAHAGGVDPQASHSTIEMRAALLNFTLPMLKLDNVRVEHQHAIIEGELARYTVHLGSGVAHQVGGTMLNIRPVHGQHMGRLFLPFADDDPQTAEVLSKVLMLAEDKKLKDPTILAQISRRVDGGN